MNACNNVLLHTFTMHVHAAIHVADGTYMLQTCTHHISTCYTPASQ